MRHRKKFNHLGRKSAHRKAMLANMATSLILHKRIKTTVAKAKALRQYVEPLITKSKNDTTHSRRVVFSYLKDKYAVTELFREVSNKIGDRPGGYTRIIKLGSRLGDNAEMCFIELVDYNENLLKEAKPKAKKRSRRGGSKSKAKATTPNAQTQANEDVKEEVKKETTEESKSEKKADEPKEETKKVEAKKEEPKETPKKEEVKSEEPKDQKTTEEDTKDEKKEDKE